MNSEVMPGVGFVFGVSGNLSPKVFESIGDADVVTKTVLSALKAATKGVKVVDLIHAIDAVEIKANGLANYTVRLPMFDDTRMVCMTYHDIYDPNAVTGAISNSIRNIASRCGTCKIKA